ncbi:hypothetical protein FJZ39_01210 [Candidatus Saccharibacteria bacterium]|nr:hypothetical protein [Candidatus Saccharibacteria bacterium]
MTKHSTKTTKLLKSLAPKSMTRHYKTQKIVQSIADEYGMVYFGRADYQHEETALVRGLTASRSNSDNHYCIGTYGGYDVVFVDRETTQHPPHTQPVRHALHMVQVDIKSPEGLPHIFLGPKNHNEQWYERVFAMLATRHSLQLGLSHAYPNQFTLNYAVYGTQTQQPYIEQLITPDTALTIANHYFPLYIELFDDHVIVYSDAPKLTAELLEVLLKNAVWLASTLDATYNSLRQRIG